MGAWGAGLFDDDTACEVRDAFVELIAKGRSPEDATTELERSWGTPQFDPDDEPVFWLALAATQVRHGRLVPSVRDRAVELIDAGGDIDRFFEEPKLRARRAAALEKLRADLLGPKRMASRIDRAVRHENAWAAGAVLAYRLRSGRLCLWRVVEHHVDKGGRHAVVEVLRGTYERLPSELAVALMPAMRERHRRRHFQIILMAAHERSERLVLTTLGRSRLAGTLRSARHSSEKPGDYLTVMPMDQDIDALLSDYLDLR